MTGIPTRCPRCGSRSGRPGAGAWKRSLWKLAHGLRLGRRRCFHCGARVTGFLRSPVSSSPSLRPASESLESLVRRMAPLEQYLGLDPFAAELPAPDVEIVSLSLPAAEEISDVPPAEEDPVPSIPANGIRLDPSVDQQLRSLFSQRSLTETFPSKTPPSCLQRPPTASSPESGAKREEGSELKALLEAVGSDLDRRRES